MIFREGQGHILKDNDGESFLDFTAGIAVNCLGHSDEGVLLQLWHRSQRGSDQAT
ncbi:unnamed protein product [Durusdinium trenchii]|uniref:Acetylornithine aminotransferase n=1 Tax=Durusdinium trenchii TaxID=1381693 RepID=A0ABP0SQX3_9DINO